MKTKLIALLLIINLGLKAQDTNIIFYDYIPDTIIATSTSGGASDTVKIDMNLDGTFDLMIYQKVYSVKNDLVKILHTDCQFAFFDSIMSDSLMSSNLVYQGDLSGIGSNWPYWRDRGRIAVRLINGSDYYYGWIRAILSYDYPRTITIDKYALCKIPNYPFLFGQTTTLTAVNELNIDNNTQVYFNSNTANIVIQSDKQIKEVKLVNMLGANVVSYNNVNAATTNINTTNLAHGNYIVQVKFANSAVYTVQVAF